MNYSSLTVVLVKLTLQYIGTDAIRRNFLEFFDFFSNFFFLTKFLFSVSDKFKLMYYWIDGFWKPEMSHNERWIRGLWSPPFNIRKNDKNCSTPKESKKRTKKPDKTFVTFYFTFLGCVLDTFLYKTFFHSTWKRFSNFWMVQLTHNIFHTQLAEWHHTESQQKSNIVFWRYNNRFC